MRIVEFASPLEDNKLNYNVVDDCLTYMRNDPMFYRKIYFPTISEYADKLRAGKKFNARKTLMPMIEKAVQGYCTKYDLPLSNEELFTEQDRISLFDRICSEENNLINKGEYK